MPLQIYLNNTTSNIYSLCPCHEPLMAQVAQSSGCSNFYDYGTVAIVRTKQWNPLSGHLTEYSVS